MPKKKKHDKDATLVANDILQSFYQPPSLDDHSAVQVEHAMHSGSLPSSPRHQPPNETTTLKDATVGAKPISSPSWTELFTRANASTNNAGSPLTQIGKCTDDVLVLPPEALYDIDSEWGYFLIGFFPTKFPGKVALLKMCDSWNVPYDYKPHQSGWLVFKFESESDRNKVLNGGPYFIFGRPLLLKVMPQDFNFDSDELKRLPVWVTLPSLPYSCWNSLSLSYIATQLGSPIQTDYLTSQKFSRASFARVMVEVDTTVPLRRELSIALPSGKQFKQAIIYEHEPKQCSICKSVGHSALTCNFRGPRDPKGKAKVKLNGHGKPFIPSEEKIDEVLRKADSPEPHLRDNSGEGSSFSKEDVAEVPLEASEESPPPSPSKLSKYVENTSKKVAGGEQPNSFHVLQPECEEPPITNPIIINDPVSDIVQPTDTSLPLDDASPPLGDLGNPSNLPFTKHEPVSLTSVGRKAKGALVVVEKLNAKHSKKLKSTVSKGPKGAPPPH